MWINEKITDQNTGIEYIFWAKVFEVGSHYGIGGNGKISKLSIKRVSDNKFVYNFDRGEDLALADEAKAVYAEILKRFN
jgi:hypothetical protein